MNCKPGDLAVIVRGLNQGRLMFVREASILGDGWWFVEVLGGPLAGRICNTKVFMRSGSIEDRRLRPIRDNPGNESWFKAAPIKTREVV